MFGFFKRKNESEAEPKEEWVPSPEEKLLFERGNRLLKNLGPEDYLYNLTSLCLAKAREMPYMEVFGHIHTCTQINATSMIGTLAQIAVWKLEEVEGSAELRKQFEELAWNCTKDALDYMRENGLPLVTH